LLHSLKHYKALHERVLILSVKVFDVPYVPDVDRVEVHHLDGNFSQVIVQYGFKDDSDIPAALALCAEAGLDIDMMDTSFFLGRETLIPKLGSEIGYWRSLIFVAMFRNAGSATAFFKIPSNRVVELGSQVVL
jgi:KUP system potassium uptake protein